MVTRISLKFDRPALWSIRYGWPSKPMTESIKDNSDAIKSIIFWISTNQTQLYNFGNPDFIALILNHVVITVMV